MVTKHSSFFNSAPRYFSQGQIDSDTAFSGSMLLRKYAGAQQALLRACAIVPSQALIPQRTRQTLVAWSRLCNQTLLPQAFWKPVLTTKCQWWNEMTNVVTPYLSKVDTWFPFKMSIERALKRWSKHSIPGTRYMPAHTSAKLRCQNYTARSASKWRNKSILLNISVFQRWK